jgi:hypothetical protein
LKEKDLFYMKFARWPKTREENDVIEKSVFEEKNKFYLGIKEIQKK